MDVLAGRVKLLGREAAERGDRFDPAAEIDPSSIVDPTCTIKAGAQIVNSVISRNCYIEERARVENSIVRGGTRIGQGATVEGAVVGKGCHIGRAVAVAKGSVLGDKTVLTDYSSVGVRSQGPGVRDG
jgi:NDP-sugar pyrophosphorylase family protein